MARREEATRPVPQPECGPRRWWSRVGPVWQAAVRDRPHLAMAIMVNPYALAWLLALPYEERKAEVRRFIDRLRHTLEEACGLNHHDTEGVIVRTPRQGTRVVHVDFGTGPDITGSHSAKLDEF
jgi:hypothetical protein